MFAFATESPKQVRVDLLVLPVFEGPEPGPGVAEVGLADAFGSARLRGARGDSLLVPASDGRFAAGAALLVGAGPRASFTPEVARRVLGRAAPVARRFGRVATTAALAFRGRQALEAVQAAAEGLGLGAYRFDRFRTKGVDDRRLRRVVVLGSERWDAAAMRAAVRRAEVVVEAVTWARDLVNTPAGDLPPAEIARAAQAMARRAGLTCRVWSDAHLRQRGFGGIIGVGKGSANPPRMIELAYRGAGRDRPIALTGKGVAFDSGGLSLKDATGMETMKDDMGGAASVLATMQAIAALRPRLNVIAAIPCVENMPSGSAQKPGDVIRHYGGTTSEVLNTDAEGRLILADALAYLVERSPELVVDVATLTGACMVALGTDIVGVFGNDDALVGRLLAAGRAVGEPIWQLPLYREYRSMLDSSVADIKNIGKRYGGAITAALFLAEFVGDVPWAHLDVAGPAFAEQDTDLGPRGATGVPVRTLVRFLLDRSA
jgi:leucyl aminopeptidase